MNRSMRGFTAGFTIVECLVTMALLSLLIAVALPVLKSIRRQAVGVSALSTLRQMNFAVIGYSNDSNGRLPFLGMPGDPSSPLVVNGHQIPTANGALFFRDQSRYWVSALPEVSAMNAGILPDGPVLIDHGYRYGAPSGKIIASRFQMTSTAFAAPEFWTPSGTSNDFSLIRGTRFSEIRNPSRKGMLLDTFSNLFTSIDSWKTSKALVGFADGSTRLEEALGATPGVDGPFLFTAFPIMETVDGLSGIDY